MAEGKLYSTPWDGVPRCGLWGLVSIVTDETFELGSFLRLGSFKIGPCVVGEPGGVNKFDFKTNDIHSLARELIAEKQRRRFRHWSIHWVLTDSSGAVQTQGLLHEDENGEITNWSSPYKNQGVEQ